MTKRHSHHASLKRLADAAQRLARRLEKQPSLPGSADDVALAVAATSVVLEFWRLRDTPHVHTTAVLATQHPICQSVCLLLEPSCAEISAAAKEVAVALSASDGNSSNVDPLLGFVEPLLAHFDASRRRALGVYFTPIAAARYLVGRSDQVLREHFQCEQGLATTDFGATKCPLRILDPALGSGIFLIALIRRIRETMLEVWKRSPTNASRLRARWSDYISQSLLPRTIGYEILAAPFVVANFLIAMELIEGGFVPCETDRLRLRLGDCLAQQENPSPPPHVIIGNPPYRGSSTNAHAWITHLLKGQSPAGEPVASYFHVDGQPLGERKTWLHDDYVKFFRFAQWQIEQRGAGLVAFVSNHGFLENPTFRGMRAGLCETFPRIEIVDLHGNTKMNDDGSDESLFETAQGMALTVAWRNGDARQSPRILRGDLRGARDGKMLKLKTSVEQSLATTLVTPQSPNYFFHNASEQSHPEYEAALRLPEIMPVSSTAVVTARDWFVIDIDRDRLLQRLHDFADLSIADDEIRARYFTRTRSTRYPAGDTRGWKLTDARRRMADETDWRQHIRRCWYRPFDRRWIFWVPWMIDWPRQEVMRQFDGITQALVCRRQSVRGRPANFFWIADDIVIDGYIRSDNRGSESVFLPPLNHATWWREFTPPSGVVHYAYALFHATQYRVRYADQLRLDFPRVLLPRDDELFKLLAAYGEKLAAAHLLKSPADQISVTEFHGQTPASVEPGFPKFVEDRVFIGRDSYFAPVSPEAWEFRVGAHQVLRKWLKDRRQHGLNAADIDTYCTIVSAISQTMATIRKIDAAVERFGGWPNAFASPQQIGPTHDDIDAPPRFVDTPNRGNPC